MVDESTVITDVFSKIYDILNSNVQSVTDSSGDTITLQARGSNYWIGAFPDLDEDQINDKSNYPLGIIHTPNKDRIRSGLNWREDDLTIELEVFANKAEHPPRFIQKAENALNNNLDDLKCEGLYNLQSDTTSTDMVMRDQIKIHSMSMPIRLSFGFEA